MNHALAAIAKLLGTPGESRTAFFVELELVDRSLLNLD